jgi:hypothetical protein
VGDIPTEEMIESGRQMLSDRFMGASVCLSAEDIRDLYSAMKAVEPDGWRPIKTPPKLGRWVLADVGGDCPVIVQRWISPTTGTEYSSADGSVYQPTHWRLVSLPPSPEGV